MSFKIKNIRISQIIIGAVIGLLIAFLFSGGEPTTPQSETASHKDEPTLWTCSMHPQIQKTEPGKCPICGMDLIPVENHGDMNEAPRQLSMSEAAKQLASIQTVAVKRQFVEKTIRLVGKVEYDETRLKYLTAWFPGRIDHLFVNFTGTSVKQGDHLADIYSPEIISDQESLLQAKQALNASGSSTNQAVNQNKQAMYERTRERLRLLGLMEMQIQEIEDRGAPSDHITFYSPIDGVVIHKNALEGDYIQTGTRIYSIADLTHVWVMMEAFESDLQWIRYGQDIVFTTVAYPGEIFHGRISFIAPFLDETTRTVQVRVNVENPQGKLKPEMFVNASLSAKASEAGQVVDSQMAGKWICYMHPEVVRDGPGNCDLCNMPLVPAESLGYASADTSEAPLLVPASAPLFTGKRAVVYVAVPNQDRPTFEGREVVLGPRMDNYYIVYSGLQEGEEVVVNGAFKIDSSLQIQAKPSMMAPPSIPDGTQEHSGHKSMSDNAAMELTHPQYEQFLAAYLKISDALASDNFESAQTSANELSDQMQTAEQPHLKMVAHNAAQADSLETFRAAFAPLSNAAIDLVKQHGAMNETIRQAFCPLALKNTGARWLQRSETIRNPYLGAAMPTCGEIQKEFSSTKKANDAHAH